jgi:hypothetical protein
MKFFFSLHGPIVTVLEEVLNEIYPYKGTPREVK